MRIAIVIVLTVLVIAVTARTPTCHRECPVDCGKRERGDGCLDCLCGEIFHGRPVRSNSRCRPTAPCPADCSQTIDRDGCTTCTCGDSPFDRPVPIRSRRQSQCASACPADCGCTINSNGRAECDCRGGPNHPLIRPTPPLPPCRGVNGCKSPCYYDTKLGQRCSICVCPLR